MDKEVIIDKLVEKALIKDNPAGQGKECTPLILIREKDRN